MCSFVSARVDVNVSLSLFLFRSRGGDFQALNTTDVIRWAKRCPWIERKPPTKGTVVVPAGSPGMCRVVMLAPTTAVSIIRQLRDAALCVVLEEEEQVCAMYSIINEHSALHSPRERCVQNSGI